MTFWRAGVEYAPGKTPKWDFVPPQAAPAYFTTEHLVGAVAPSEFEGLQVLGSYGDAWLIESHYVPAGYFIVAATGGLDSDMNPVGFREHVNTAHQGPAPHSRSGSVPVAGQLLCQGFWRRRPTSRRGGDHAGDRKLDLHTANHQDIGLAIMSDRVRNSRDPEKDYGYVPEFGFGPGLVPPGRETAPPIDGGIYRAKCPPVELIPSDDLSVRVKQTRWRPGGPPRGCPGERVG